MKCIGKITNIKGQSRPFLYGKDECTLVDMVFKSGRFSMRKQANCRCVICFIVKVTKGTYLLRFK